MTASASPVTWWATAPASSANLGPGYDILALALELRCRVTVEPSSEWRVRSAGAPAGDDALRLLRRMAETVGSRGAWSVDVDSAVPRGSGLGSSAAVITSGIAALRSALDLPTDPARVFLDAAEVEGHPDNVAAAVWGGLVAVSPAGVIRPLELHPSLRVIVAVPDIVLRTEDARRPMVAPVRTEAAVRTAARLVFLVEGLRTGDRALLAEAAEDELHELRRAHLSQRTVRLVRAARDAGALHAAWSGAGPSALAVVDDRSAAPVAAAWREIVGREGGSVLEPEIATTGLTVG